MEKSVKGIRESYYDSIIKDYRKEEEKSFLYRTFWAESVRELLKKSLPPLPEKDELRKQMEELSRGFLDPLTDEKNKSEQMKEYFDQLPEEVKKLLKVHLPQLPEGVVNLLKEHSGQLPEEVKGFPWLLKEEIAWLRYGSEIRSLLKESMLERPEWAHKVLKQKPPKRMEKKQGSEQEKQKKERRDFWEELMLNDAGYKAGLITDAEYYLWLTEYLTIRDIYYKDTSMSGGHVWLYKLLNVGLGRKLEDIVKRDEAQKLEEKIEKLEKEIDETKELQKRGEPLKPGELKKREEKYKKYKEKLEEIKRLKESQECGVLGKSENLKNLEEDFAKLVEEKLEELGKRLQGVQEFYGFEEDGRPDGLEEVEERRRNIRDKAGVGRDMAELAEELRHEMEAGGTEISNRLHGLKCKEKTAKGEIGTWDYLLWLTGQLKRMAVHIKVKTWLQDNGYPIVDVEKTKKQDEAEEQKEAEKQEEAKKQDEIKKLFQECRKQDFSLRLFGAYCDSKKGYYFTPKKDSDIKGDENWVVKNGFCEWKPDGLKNHLRTLLEAFEQEGREDFYLPLAIDLHSGCVFFLAGKGYYAEVYEKSNDEVLKKKYRDKDAFFCYDYLRLDKRKDFEDSVVAFRLQPTFHEKAGKNHDYDKILKEFKWYCGSGRDIQRGVQNIGSDQGYYFEDTDDIPRQKIKVLNEKKPKGIAEVFQLFFEASTDSKTSQKAGDAFRQTQKKMEDFEKKKKNIVKERLPVR